MAHVLPPDWQDVVTRVSRWLVDATLELDRHEKEFVARFPAAELTPADTSALADRLADLPRRLAPLEAATTEADGGAIASESALRDLTRRSETLRLRLAEWVGRAIG
jgi:hypothetical protein